MSGKWGTRFAAMATAAVLTGFGLLTAGAGAAMATGTGTSGPGDSTAGPGGTNGWSFGTFDPNWNYHEGIQIGQTTTSYSTTNATSTQAGPVSYKATVQQPINAPGQIPSVFSNKTRTIPVKYVVQMAPTTVTVTTPTTTTTTTTGDSVYPDMLQSNVDPNIVSSNLNWTPPASEHLTVGQVSSLEADFTWQTGANHTGSMYWIMNTPDGNVWVYYGDITGTGVFTGTSGSGANMITLGGARAEASQLGYSPQYDTLANILAAAPSSGSVPTIGQEPVNWIGLAVDEGASGPQGVQLQDVNITTPAGVSTYVPGTVPGSSSTTTATGTPTYSAPAVSGPYVQDNSAPAWLYLNKVSGSTPGPIDESLITDTQGDTGGQFRQVDGMYMYNFPVSQLADTSAQYQFGIRIGSTTADPAGVVQWGIR